MKMAHERAGWRFARSRNDRVIGGVAGGLAHRLGVDATVPRLAFLVLALAGGFGVLAYIACWALAEEPIDHPVAERAGAIERSVAIALFVGAALVLLRGIGMWPGDGIMWLATNAAVGSALLSIRSSADDRARWSTVLTPDDDGRRLFRWIRWIVGAALVAIGVGGILLGHVELSAIGDVGLAVGVTVAAAGIVLGPWLTRVVRDLGAERRERVRAEEHERIAAHLHDSVLQTFALIQRASDDPRRMATLARRQERELRAWLYEGRELADASAVDLRSALEQLAHDIEGLHDLRVDTVIVGDTGIDERATQLVAAVREALTNVGKHAEAEDVSLYVEVSDRALSAYVRDRGVGFNPEVGNGDGRGIADSIVGRLRRLGGSAEVHSTPGDGTEIVMEIPR